MRIGTFLLSVCVLSFCSAPLSAQCFVPDGLDPSTAGCGAQTGAKVLKQPFKTSALGICWQDCGVLATANYRAVWNTIVPVIMNTPPSVSCAWFRAAVQVFNASNTLIWNGSMQMSYSRTWIESPTPLQHYQVWRYLVNGDMRAGTANSMPCGTPPCAASFGNVVRFTGYVDYALDCSTNQISTAWMLTHACDAIDHLPGVVRGGVFHPNRFYSLVGPSAGFVAGLGATLEAGPLTDEGLRRWDATAATALCYSEEPLLAASAISTLSVGCLCGTGPSNWYEGQLFASSSFGTIVSPFPGSDPFRSFPIGSWTNPAVYPGVEELRWNCNEAQWVDCTGASRNEYYFGVTTAGGYPALSFGTATNPLGSTFIDQSNSVLLPANVAVRNVPYRSDHVLNLNQ